VGIEAAGNGGDFVKQEGDTAMTKAREPAPTVAFIDDYCAHYQSVFSNVRQFEQFSRLELGWGAETKRKSLPRLAQATKADPQACHHFLAKADWSVEAVHAIRLELTRQARRERPFILCSDETGDRKKGKTTDDAAHQYIGTVHPLATGVVSVNA
jgi:SRSO17 transposase